MNLTIANDRIIVLRVVAKSATGINSPIFTSALALIRSVFFVPALWWAVWRLFGAPPLVSGTVNSAWSTAFIRLTANGGGSQFNHEATDMPKSVTRDIASKTNPLIGNTPADTIQYVTDAISFFQDYSILMPKIDFCESSANGYYLLGQCMRLALLFEYEEMAGDRE